MRRGNKPEVVLDNNNTVGFFTSADFCAEHECGYTTLRNLLGCKVANPKEADCKHFGIQTRMIDPKAFKEASFFHKTATWAVLIIQSSWLLKDRDYTKVKNFPHDLNAPSEEYPISAAWCESAMGIAVHKKLIKRLETIYKACLEGHGCLLFSRQLPVFDNGGLVLADARMIPAATRLDMENADREVFELYETHRKIGIEDRLNAHNQALYKKGHDRWNTNWRKPYIRLDDGTEINKENYNPVCSWMALSPRKKTNEKTAYPLVYWLNTDDQQQNNCTWVTVEDLEDWMQGKGKIPGRGYGLGQYVRTQSVASGKVRDLYSDEVYCKTCKEIVNTKRMNVQCCPNCRSVNIIKGTR